MQLFACPYLKDKVELSEEREVHIARNHPDLLPAHLAQIEKTLDNPDQVRRSTRPECRPTVLALV